MGINRSNPNPYRTTFLKSHEGSLVIEHAEPPTDENGVRVKDAYLRPHKTKGEIWCEPIFNIEGIICDISISSFEYNVGGTEIEIESLDITLGDSDTGDLMKLTELLGSKQANSIFYCLPNIDPNLQTKIFAREYQAHTYLSVLQYQEQLGKWKAAKSMAKDDENYQVPPLEVVKFKGKEQWDDTARNEFFKEALRQWIEQYQDVLEANKNLVYGTRTNASPEDSTPPTNTASGTEDLDALLAGVKEVKSNEDVSNLIGEKGKRGKK